jgi:hypothetical protein
MIEEIDRSIYGQMMRKEEEELPLRTSDIVLSQSGSGLVYQQKTIHEGRYILQDTDSGTLENNGMDWTLQNLFITMVEVVSMLLMMMMMIMMMMRMMTLMTVYTMCVCVEYSDTTTVSLYGTGRHVHIQHQSHDVCSFSSSSPTLSPS